MEIEIHSKNSLFQKSFKRNYTISTTISNLGVWCKKWSNWTSRFGQTKKSDSDFCDSNTDSATL